MRHNLQWPYIRQGLPGSIFLAGESVAQLPTAMQGRATRFGRRRLKGIGPVDVWTLNWRPDADLYETATTIDIVVDLAGVTEDGFGGVYLFASQRIAHGVNDRVPSSAIT